MNKKQYINEIVQRSCLPSAERRRLKTDLENEINAALEGGEYIEQIIERMGDPDKVAAEIYENFAQAPVRPFREYKSELTLFGLPLVHIIRVNYSVQVTHVRGFAARGVSFGGRYGYVNGLPTARGIFAFGPKAKGVVAVGNLAAGFISVGNVSAGVASIGNVCAGLISISNLGLALLLALGNFAAGPLSGGNLAIGYAAAGNVAVGQYAVGNEAAGAFTFAISNFIAQFAELKAFLAALNMPSAARFFYDSLVRFAEFIMVPNNAVSFAITLAVAITFIILMIILTTRKLLGTEYEQNFR